MEVGNKKRGIKPPLVYISFDKVFQIPEFGRLGPSEGDLGHILSRTGVPMIPVLDEEAIVAFGTPGLKYINNLSDLFLGFFTDHNPSFGFRRLGEGMAKGPRRNKF